MSGFSRRDFLRRSSFGLAAAGAGGLVLRADAQPTAESGSLGEYEKVLRQQAPLVPPMPNKLAATEDNILGPFYREGAPFRAKVTPPLEPGTVLVINGRVWGLDTRKPLAGVSLEVWQANAQGRYDNDDPRRPPAKDVFRNRARLLTDETGYYEYETIHPAPYKTGPNTWRPSHIHYLVRHKGYKQLVTQLYFKGDPHNKTDEFIKESLIIGVRKVKIGGQMVEVGAFDVVLAPER